MNLSLSNPSVRSLAIAALLAVPAFAQDLPFVLRNGDPANADQVMANLNALKAANATTQGSVTTLNTTVTNLGTSVSSLTSGLAVNGAGTVLANKGLVVDNSNTSLGDLTNGLVFGGAASGEGIACRRVAGTNLYGLNFFTGGSNRMVISQSGDVGIKVAAPLATLHVNGSIRADGPLRMAVPANSISIELNGSIADNGRMISLTPTTYIGSSAGSLRFFTQGSGASQASLSPNGDFFCTAVNPSSRRFKENVASMTDGLDLAMKLRPVTFDWNEEHSKRRGFVHDFGFIAEEVQELLPHVVAKDEEGNVAGVDYARLSSIAIAAVQTQQASLDALRRENEALKARVAGLEAMAAEVAAMKTAMQSLLAK